MLLKLLQMFGLYCTYQRNQARIVETLDRRSHILTDLFFSTSSFHLRPEKERFQVVRGLGSTRLLRSCQQIHQAWYVCPGLKTIKSDSSFLNNAVVVCVEQYSVCGKIYTMVVILTVVFTTTNITPCL